MKQIQVVGLIVCVGFLLGCVNTQTAGMGNQERKRLAALQQQEQQPQPDQSEQNLWSAQEDTLNRDSNPFRSY